MNVEELINKKKEEIIEEVKSETEGLHESNTAVEKLEKFAAELKMAIDMNPIGAKDLLEVIEKGGCVYQKVVDIFEDCSSGRVSDVMEYIEKNSYPLSSQSLYGKQRVTLIIEPMEEQKNE